MADFPFIVALGRAVELYNRVDLSDPANAVLIVSAWNTTETDANIMDIEDIAAIEANVNSAEVTNTGYARKVLTDTDIVAYAPDFANNQADIDIPDQTWTGVAAGDAWTDLNISYDSDSTLGTDADIEPISQHDFVATPDGSDITAQIHADGFYRAQPL